MEKHTAELSEELARRGHEVHILAHSDYRSNFSEIIKFHSLPVHLGRRNPWLKFCLSKVLRSLSADILHAQGSKAADLLSGFKKQRTIRVGTVHGTKSNDKAFHRLDGVIAVSKGVQQSLSHANSKLIYNGIKQPESDTKASTRPSEAGEFALAIGRFEPVKQFDKLVAAWAALKPPLPLYILGDGSEAKALKAQIYTLNAEDFIKLPGYVNNPLVWLEQASVCIVSSEREGFPYAIVESLLAGCPVLSTPVNGAIDLLPAESLATSTSQNAIKALLSSQIPNIEKLKQSQSMCFEKASRELTLEAMVTQTESFYDELISTAFSV